MAESDPASPPGLLHPDEFGRHVELRRTPAPPEIEPWADIVWSLRWDLPGGRRFESEVLAHPTCALTVELGSHPRPELPTGETLVVTGVATRRFDVEIRGWGSVRGVRFRPGGLAALVGGPATDWTDRVVPAGDLLPAGLCARLSDPHLVDDADAWTATAAAGMCELAPASDPRFEEVCAIVADMSEDASLLTVADVCARHRLSVRALQRRFSRYVGVGPKWVLGRYRMHDVVDEINGGFPGTLTELAHRYGWFDQAHFTRDFTALVGVTPGRYRDRVLRAREREDDGAAD